MKSQPAQPDLAESLAPGREAGGNSRAPWLAWPLCLLSVALALASLILGFLNGRTLDEILVKEVIATIAVLAVAFSVVGALIVSCRPKNPIGWIFCAAALCQGLVIFGEEYATYALITRPGSLPLGAEASWLKEWIWAPGLGLVLVFLPLLFPDGRPPTRRWRWVIPFGSLSIGLISVLGAILFWPHRGPALMAYGGEAEDVVAPVWALVTDFVAFPMMLVAGLGAVISLFVRFRRARRDERQQIKWFIFASALTLAFTFLFEELPYAEGGLVEVILVAASLIIVPSIPVATGVAVFKYRLYDIDLVINRALVYSVLTACVVGIYVLVVGYLGALFRTGGNLLISLIATGIVAVLFAPLRDRLQRGINRLMYGERDDPYAVISHLGERLKATDAPEAVLPTIVETAAQALKLSHAAIALKQNDGEFETVADCGNPKGEPLILPLSYGTETIGQLILSPRVPGEPFDPADKRLLDALARHAEAAAYAVRLTADLQKSRERLVSAREEERRRLRRDLHDGLGPQLATLTLKLDAARNLLSQEEMAGADTLLAELKTQTQDAISDIRRLVYDLRPPALDELGLVPAIREQATSYSPYDLNISVEAPEELPPLPAAIEVAAYRIVQEALTNVSRHARASVCRLRIFTGRGLVELEITDNGIGLPEARRVGVGLSSMRERAAELGGTCAVEPIPDGGTRVLARLPLPASGEKP